MQTSASLEPRARSGANPLAVVPGALAVDAGPALPGDGLLDDAEHGASATGESDQGAEHRHPGHERLGPVDGVEHPDVLGVAPVVAELLADDPMARIARGDQFAEPNLHRAVDFGDRRRVRLAVHDMTRADRVAHDLAGGIGQVVREFDDGAPNRFDHCAATGRTAVTGRSSGHGMPERSVRGRISAQGR